MPRRFFWLGAVVFAVIAGSSAHAQESAGLSARSEEVANGVSLHVVESGKSEAEPALVFIPGWSAGADVWQQQLKHFGSSHRVISFDPRSQGDSTKAMSGNTPEVRAQDLDRLLERLQARRPVLIGWSQ